MFVCVHSSLHRNPTREPTGFLAPSALFHWFDVSWVLVRSFSNPANPKIGWQLPLT